MTCPHTRNDSHFIGSMLILGDSLSLLHQHCPIALVLELVGVSSVNWDNGAIDMQFANE
jgi:hypothetical protein